MPMNWWRRSRAGAAVAEDGEPCVTYIGADRCGAVKEVVHNGIEYMAICSLSLKLTPLLKAGLNLSNERSWRTLLPVE